MEYTQELFGTIALITALIGLLPQVYKAYITKSTQDVSMIMLVNYVVGSAAWAVYGAMTDSIFVILSNIAGLIISVISVMQKAYYDKQKHKAFYDHIGNEHHYRSILALNGDLPSKSFFKANIPIIAADGAINALSKMGIKTNVVVGDLDSANPNLLHDIKVIYKPDQDSCDFQKSLDHSSIENLMPSIIVGISGGAIDHILQNINLFSKTDSIFYADHIVGYSLAAGCNKSLILPINTKISLIGMGACVSSKGLKWELQEYQMKFPGANSSFNRSASQEVTITIHQGLCLMMIYLDDVLDLGITE